MHAHAERGNDLNVLRVRHRIASKLAPTGVTLRTSGTHALLPFCVAHNPSARPQSTVGARLPARGRHGRQISCAIAIASQASLLLQVVTLRASGTHAFRTFCDTPCTRGTPAFLPFRVAHNPSARPQSTVGASLLAMTSCQARQGCLTRRCRDQPCGLQTIAGESATACNKPFARCKS
jgi:hypothetical protein